MDKRISRGCPSPGDTKCVYTLPFYLFSSRPKDVVRPAMPKTRRAPRGPVLCLALLAKLARRACLLRLNNYSVYCVSPRVWPSSFEVPPLAHTSSPPMSSLWLDSSPMKQ